MRELSFRVFLAYAEKLHLNALEEKTPNATLPFIIGSILTSWISLESFVNNMLQDYASMPEDTFTVHERGFLEEKQVVFNRTGTNAGTFSIGTGAEFKRLEDKVLFLLAKFGDGKIDKGGRLWQRFEKVKKTRNALTHYRRDTTLELGPTDSGEAIELTKDLIGFLSKEVWKKSVNW